MEKINDECLKAVFKYLDFKDLIKVEGVNKKWRRASKSVWAVKQPKSVHLHQYLEHHFTAAETTFVVGSIFERCGKFIDYLDMSLELVQHSKNIGMLVAIHCPFIKTLDLDSTHLSCDSLKAIADNCRMIENLYLCRMNGDFEEGLGKILASNKCLESLKIIHCENFTGASLVKIESKCLEELEIISCEQFDIRFINGFAEKPHSNKLRNLVKLCLDTEDLSTVNDEEFICLGRICPFIQNCVIVLNDKITWAGLKPLFQLPLLKKLWIANEAGAKENLLGKIEFMMPNVEDIFLRSIPLTDANIIALINSATNLQSLEMQSCGVVVGSKLENTLSEIVLRRKNRIGLRINNKHILHAKILHLTPDGGRFSYTL